jgi:hypothetical protein
MKAPLCTSNQSPALLSETVVNAAVEFAKHSAHCAQCADPKRALCAEGRSLLEKAKAAE